MFVKLMFFAIETLARGHTCTHRKKRQERQKREEKEINSRQHRCISINPPVYSFTLFILVLEPGCQTLFPHKWRVLEDLSVLQIWQQTYGFISQVCVPSPALSKKTINAAPNYKVQLLGGDGVCLLGGSSLRKEEVFEEFEQNPTQHLCEILTWKSRSANKSN